MSPATSCLISIYKTLSLFQSAEALGSVGQELGTKTKIYVYHSKGASWAGAEDTQKRFDEWPRLEGSRVEISRSFDSKSGICPSVGECEGPLQITPFSVY